MVFVSSRIVFGENAFTEKIVVEDREFEGFSIAVDVAPFLLIRSKDGCVLGCGFLDIAAADALNSCAVKVKGVKTFDDMMTAKVVEVSKAAKKKGISIGMTGKAALLRF
ncbi:hypothetical protein MsAg5_18130 [Methanosarcinaceae archaeon Ag5]|uniref:DUF1805 domain-containing protein n=1 Tax=Methanolapillus africanus TaxID=3028297 RepID=A0AAE4SDX9_9EURY|nr:hypothetical protein [Methanosarcinaceae archaeon Ag5]